MCIVERVVNFLACIVENQRKVRRQLYSTFVKNASGWYHGSTHTQTFFFLRWATHTNLTTHCSSSFSMRSRVSLAFFSFFFWFKKSSFLVYNDYKGLAFLQLYFGYIVYYKSGLKHYYYYYFYVCSNKYYYLFKKKK